MSALVDLTGRQFSRFEQRCLRDVADFCESQTKLQREAAAIRRTEKDVA